MDTPLGPLYVGGVVGCSACSALLSGLTLGLLQLDPLQLQAQQRVGDTRQAARAARLLPLTARTHQMLCALVLCNAAVSAALPLCLDRLLNPLAAILISSTAVVVFSEIIPQVRGACG
jgi:metal transporter CNNM